MSTLAHLLPAHLLPVDRGITPALPPAGEIDGITKEIHVLESHAMEHAGSAVQFKIEIGRRLMRAKEILPHGEFIPWATREFQWDRKHLWRHMALARNVARVPHLPPDASLRAVLAAIAPARREQSAEKTERLSFTLVAEGGDCLELDFRVDSAQASLCRRVAEDGGALRVVRRRREETRD